MHTAADRLECLCATDAHHSWTSLDETRRCILCEEKFTGHQVRFTTGRHGELKPHCPTEHCSSTPREWVAIGNPLLDDETWRDWSHILADSADGEPEQGTLRTQSNNNLPN